MVISDGVNFGEGGVHSCARGLGPLLLWTRRGGARGQLVPTRIAASVTTTRQREDLQGLTAGPMCQRNSSWQTRAQDDVMVPWDSNSKLTWQQLDRMTPRAHVPVGSRWWTHVVWLASGLYLSMPRLVVWCELDWVGRTILGPNEFLSLFSFSFPLFSLFISFLFLIFLFQLRIWT